MPAELSDITEPAAQQMAARMQRTPVAIPSLPIPPLETAFVGPSKQQQAQLRALSGGAPPVVLLHGFDSSCLEFRRLYPLLEARTETWAVDLVSGCTPGCWVLTKKGAAVVQPLLQKLLITQKRARAVRPLAQSLVMCVGCTHLLYLAKTFAPPTLLLLL